MRTTCNESGKNSLSRDMSRNSRNFEHRRLKLELQVANRCLQQQICKNNKGRQPFSFKVDLASAKLPPVGFCLFGWLVDFCLCACVRAACVCLGVEGVGGRVCACVF